MKIREDNLKKQHRAVENGLREKISEQKKEICDLKAKTEQRFDELEQSFSKKLNSKNVEEKVPAKKAKELAKEEKVVKGPQKFAEDHLFTIKPSNETIFARAFKVHAAMKAV